MDVQAVTVWTVQGERLLGRRLERDRRDRRFKPGQHQAHLDPTTGIMVLGYVDAFGHAVRVELAEHDGFWRPYQLQRAGMYVLERPRNPDEVGFRLSQTMRDAIALAEQIG